MKRICPHPFSTVNVDIEGRYRLCCEAKAFNVHVSDMSPEDFFNSNIMNNVRDEFIDDDAFDDPNIAKYCSSCKFHEKTSGQSKRKKDIANSNSAFTWNFINNIDEYIETGKITKQYSGLHIEGFGNRCNLKCLHCNNRLSSTWAKFHEKVSVDPARPLAYDYFYGKEVSINSYWLFQEFMFANNNALHKFIEQVKTNKDLMEITATGGEALLNKHFRIFYKEIVKHNPNILVSINTNASIPTKLIKDAINLRHHPRLTRFNFSYDGLDEIHEFIRDNSTWQEYEDCLDILVPPSSLKSNRKIYADGSHHLYYANGFASIQVLNIFQFEEMVLYSKRRQFHMDYHLVYNPEHLNISILPKEIKDTLIDKYSKINNDNFYDQIINALKFDHNPVTQKQHLQYLYRFLDMQSEFKNKDWRPIFPELAEVEEKYK